MLLLLELFLLFNYLILICTESDELDTKVRSMKNILLWRNATIPFYIDTEHFDHEQSLAIMKVLSTFAYKTCLKFAPVMDRPREDQHVMLFVNPSGIKRCKIDTVGHSVFSPHSVFLGYECLKSPQIEMKIMRALGFNFEHNKHGRNNHIDIMMPNIETNALELFSEDLPLPPPLQALPYDINSVMHFGERDYSKNGYRTIKFRSNDGIPKKQNRIGLTAIDLKKIDLVYGPECLKRDRQEKIELCQSYPGVVRRKRDVEPPTTLKNLRVNRDITPPASNEKGVEAEKNNAEENEVSKNLKALGVEEEAQDVVELIYKVSSKALKNAREKYCNNTEVYNSVTFNRTEKRNSSDIIGILEYVTEYVDSMVDNAMSNMTIFCQNPESLVVYQRQQCNWNFDNRCVPSYKSTKSGLIRYSTQHRPHIIQSTWHYGYAKSYSYDKVAWRSRNASHEVATPQAEVRRKRAAFDDEDTSRDKQHYGVKEKNIGIRGKNSKAGNRRRYLESQQYRPLNQATSSEQDTSASRISGEMHDRALTLESEVIKEPPSLALKSDKFGMKNGRETKYFGTASKEAVVKEKSLNDVDRGETEEETDRKLQKYNVKNKINDELNMKNLMDIKQERNKMRVERLEKTSRDVTQNKKRAAVEVPSTVTLTKLNREFYTERMWPEGVVRYVISPLEGYDLDDMRSRLAEVNDILKQKTCVRMKEVSEEEAKNHEDYLVLDTSPDYITGRVGGKQHFGCIELFKGGQHRQHTAMMVMAMLGFYFEVSRHDRDKYIRVHMRHVRPDKLHHFEKIRDEATLDVPYDFNSATHPAWQFWRKIGKTGISTVATYKTLDPSGSIMRTLGQHRKLLSDIDIVKINSVYGTDCFTESTDNINTDVKYS